MSYLGSKAGAGVYQAIIAAMPPHDIFVDAFVGSGAILRYKPPAAFSVGIDRDFEALAAAAQDTGDYASCASFVCGDSRSLLAGFNYDAGRTFVYCDPPYLLSTRTSRHRYRFEFSDADHVDFLALLHALPCAVMVSGYPSQLYDEILAGWRTIEFQAMTRGGVRTEKLWLNYPADTTHWATFAGKNFTDRQRIKRKAARWAASYRQLPAGERLAILAGLLQEH